MSVSLGRLERIELREIWEREDQDFTPWLAEEESLSILGKTFNMELQLDAQEKAVGSFSADILCTNTDDNSKVLIENQLEKTNHTHLGQLLTYAAGLHTVSIVWIARQFTDEHRATLDWLNEITDTQFRFFGLEVELWRIGTSDPAPKFNIISKPNDWSRSISQAVRNTANQTLSELQKLQLQYWESLKEFGERQSKILRFQSPRAQHWYNFGIGRTDAKLVALVNSRTSRITVGFESFGDTGKAFFDLLHKDKEEIEQELGFALDWHRLDNKKASAIWYSKDGDIWRTKQWEEEFHKWMIAHLEALDKVLRPRVKSLDLSEWNDPSEDMEI